MRPERARPIVIGHRGAMGHAPENTAAAFARGLALGADWLECDVHRSKDGRVVVIHDATLDRTTDGRGPVRDRAWKALRRLDAGRWFGPRFAGQRLWTLDELARWARHRRNRAGRPVGLVVEIKKSADSGAALPAAVVRVLSRHRMTERTVVISFDPRALRVVKRLRPALRTGFLFSDAPRSLARRVAHARADGVFPRHTRVTPAVMRLARRRGWFVGTWTADAPADLRRLARLGVDAVATNFPERVALPR